LCNNESFLRKAKATKEAGAEQGESLWHIPPRSPDLNPVEKFWAWLRRELRRLDLQDLSKKKRSLTNQHTRCASAPFVDRRKRNAWQVILPRA
jgi:transposase